jgi:hypothetical protein
MSIFSHLCTQRNHPPHCGQKLPAWDEAALASKVAGHPRLGGASVGPPLIFSPPVRQNVDLSLSLRAHTSLSEACFAPPPPLYAILGQVGILQLTVAAPKTLRKIVSTMKRHNRDNR